MRTVDYGGMIVVYNFVIGILIMLSSEKLGQYAGALNSANSARLSRLTVVSSSTLGITWAALSGVIYLLFYVLRLGV